MMKLCTVLAIIALASCGPLYEGSVGERVATAVISRLIDGPPEPVADPAPSRAQLDANPGKFMRVYITNQTRWVTMVQAGANGNRATWVSGDSLSITLEGGIIVATRGFPRDLMAANATSTRDAIRAGGGNSRREHEFLTNLDGISTEVLQCRIASKGQEVIEPLQKAQNSTRFEEECSGENRKFTNVYWVNSAGIIIRSQQTVSRDTGYLQVDVF